MAHTREGSNGGVRKGGISDLTLGRGAACRERKTRAGAGAVGTRGEMLSHNEVEGPIMPSGTRP